MAVKTYQGRVVRILDGDTVEAEIDLGFYTSVKPHLRMYGINANETRGRDLDLKKLGELQKNHLLSMIHGQPCEFIIHGKDKYQPRWVATIVHNGEDINEKMKEYISKTQTELAKSKDKEAYGGVL